MTRRYQALALASYLDSATAGRPSLAVALLALRDGLSDDPRGLYRAIIRLDIDRGERGIPSVDG